MRKVNSAEVFTSYGNLEARLVVTELTLRLQDKVNPQRYPLNLYRDDEMKTTIQLFRHGSIQKASDKHHKNDSLPDIAKVSTGGDGKKGQGIESKGVVNIKGGAGGKGDQDFNEYSFKEGSTATVKLQDIFIQDKGKDALKKLNEQQQQAHAAAKVKGGAKGKKKAASKGKSKSSGKKSAEKADADAVKDKVGKLLSFTPSKKKGTPGKKSAGGAKKSVGKRGTPAMPSPGGKKSTRTTDQMTMNQFKKYLEWHDKKKGKTLNVKGGKSSARSGGKRSRN